MKNVQFLLVFATAVLIGSCSKDDGMKKVRQIEVRATIDNGKNGARIGISDDDAPKIDWTNDHPSVFLLFTQQGKHSVVVQSAPITVDPVTMKTVFSVPFPQTLDINQEYTVTGALGVERMSDDGKCFIKAPTTINCSVQPIDYKMPMYFLPEKHVGSEVLNVQFKIFGSFLALKFTNNYPETEQVTSIKINSENDIFSVEGNMDLSNLSGELPGYIGNPIKNGTITFTGLNIPPNNSATPKTVYLWLKQTASGQGILSIDVNNNKGLVYREKRQYTMQDAYSYRYPLGLDQILQFNMNIAPWTLISDSVVFENDMKMEYIPIWTSPEVYGGMPQIKDKDGIATFKFKLISPVEVEWIPSLTDGLDFAFTSDSPQKGKSGIEYTIKIKTLKDPASVRRSSEFYLSVNGKEIDPDDTPSAAGPTGIGQGNRYVVYQSPN